MNPYYQFRAKRYYQDQKISDFYFLGSKKVDITFAIPNNNGMNRGLPKLLDSIYCQEGVNVKIVVVDSGSIDNSVEYCRSRGCDVIKIKPEKFSHSYSRNMALERVSTDYVIYTVNDAYFNDKFYAAKAIFLIKKFDLVAISGMQYTPHTDVYSRYLERSLIQRFAPIGHIRTTKKRPHISSKLLPSYIASSLYGLDNVNATYNTHILKKIKFSNKTVEDMSMAKALVELGYKIGITLDISVIHGHIYSDSKEYFKRVISDLIVIKKLFLVGLLPIPQSRLFPTFTLFYVGLLKYQQTNHLNFSPIKLFFYINFFAFARKYKVTKLEMDLFEEKIKFSSKHLWKNNYKTNAVGVLVVSFYMCKHLRFANKEHEISNLFSHNNSKFFDQFIKNLIARLLAPNMAANN